MAAIISFMTTYMAAINLKEALEGTSKPGFVFLMLFSTPGAIFSLLQFVAFFGPLIGIVLGFDSINRERVQGTLIKLLSQPIHRDSVINGKFLASMITVGIMLLSIILVVSGFGLFILGVIPGSEELVRLALFFVLSLFYIGFWLALSMLFSVVFKSITTSALAAFVLWIFLSFFLPLLGDVLAKAGTSQEINKLSETELFIKQTKIKETIELGSVMALFSKSSSLLIDPTRKTVSSIVVMGPVEKFLSSRFKNPLSLDQSLLVIYPYALTIVALTILCFGISYTVFILQEVRT
jgi:ABC-2 type transport system permease protein